ncbi:MAG: single-stranded-DNA-specific exonuclease RecJ [Bacteroidetes bacterium]|nr:MAG: single-stranded-DNA-specific exonuclease RecJ [Bacteroidota bacterium]
MNKKVILREKGDEVVIRHLQDVLGINEVLATLLTQRGITTFDEAKTFFRPSLDDLHNPFLMKDMDRAIARLNKALLQNEKILIYGDYDVDGTTSVALVYSFLKKQFKQIGYYIPDRYSEGYGISFQGIDFAEANNFSLIIALDCGIKAVEKIDYANKKNIDFIICDHHTPGDKIPNAIAVLDPKRSDCEYPDKNLSGCGVGFKLLQAFSDSNGVSFEELYGLIDLTAVSIASDIVPVIGENRILAFYGLKKLYENPITGLKTIKTIAGVKDKKLTISDCVFKIGPRINAAGRIESGMSAVELLISENSKDAHGFAKAIDIFNTERKELDRSITHDALRTIGTDIDLRNRKSTVVYNKDWHKGVVGIVASRLTETYYRPTVVLGESNGMASGSARSVSDYNVYDAINACSRLLESFGGHKFAAGLSLKVENVEAFSECFEKYVSETITPEQLVPVIQVDAELKFSDIDRKFFNVMNQMAPFGPGNMSPVFITKNVKDTGNSRRVGANKEHLKLEVVDKDGVIMPGIAFSFEPEYYEKMSSDSKPCFDICYSINKNEFHGKINIQLSVKEIIFVS